MLIDLFPYNCGGSYQPHTFAFVCGCMSYKSNYQRKTSFFTLWSQILHMKNNVFRFFRNHFRRDFIAVQFIEGSGFNSQPSCMQECQWLHTPLKAIFFCLKENINILTPLYNKLQKKSKVNRKELNRKEFLKKCNWMICSTY